MPLSLSDLNYEGRESKGTEKRERGKGRGNIKWMMVDGVDGRAVGRKGRECVYLLVQCVWGAWSLLGAGRAGACLCG